MVVKRGDSHHLGTKIPDFGKAKVKQVERTVRGNWHLRKKPPRPSFDSFLLSFKFKPQHHQGLRINLRVQTKQEKVSVLSFDLD